MNADNWNHSGFDTAPIRVLTPGGAGPVAGPGWQRAGQAADAAASSVGANGDCWLVESGDLAAISVDDLARSGLPVVARVDDRAPVDAGLIDVADGYVLPGDDPAIMGAVFAAATARAPAIGVRDLSDGTARTINALSAEAGRIADALARLAEAQEPRSVVERPVDAALVRRLLRLRRDRDRYFPDEIFADPAWDMLLDLAAARLEGKPVPVSSLCIAAAVPTTTALRWVRSLTEAGLLLRRLDPADARRTYISLSDTAASAMFAWLRLFSDQFVARQS